MSYGRLIITFVDRARLSLLLWSMKLSSKLINKGTYKSVELGLEVLDYSRHFMTAVDKAYVAEKLRELSEKYSK